MTTTANALTIDDYLDFHTHTPEERDELRAKIDALQQEITQAEGLVTIGIDGVTTQTLEHNFLGAIRTYECGFVSNDLGLEAEIKVEGSVTDSPKLVLYYRKIANYVRLFKVFDRGGFLKVFLAPQKSDYLADMPQGAGISYETDEAKIERLTLPIEMIRGINSDKGYLHIPRVNETSLRTGKFADMGIIDPVTLLTDRAEYQRLRHAAKKAIEYHRAA